MSLYFLLSLLNFVFSSYEFKIFFFFFFFFFLIFLFSVFFFLFFGAGAFFFFIFFLEIPSVGLFRFVCICID